MRTLSFSKYSILTTIFAAIFLIAISSSQSVLAQGQFHGAIYTTINDGTGVNVNQFDSKPAVYLNGGPQQNNPNGLPDGQYFYQVTDPSGAVLLSTDNADCRRLQVVGGRIFGSVPGMSCPGHMNGLPNMSNGSIPVQLMPFADTPNNGGEYKVWLIRQASTTTIDSEDPRVIHFNNNNSKTDNFRIRDNCEVNPEDPICNPNPPDVVLKGHKFYDANANTLFDMGELPVAGVQIVIELTTPQGPLPPVTVTTDMNGDWMYGPVQAGWSYTIYENLPCVDANADMICDPNPPNYWVQTAPVADGDGFQGYMGVVPNMVPNNMITGLNFGDICFHQGSGGYTLGFWSNKNGMANMNGERSGVNVNVFPTAADNPMFPELGLGMAGDLNFLKRLNLKTTQNDKFGNALNFDPTTYPQFRTWLLSGNAVNMAYMLSVQLSATSLNCRHEFLFDNQIVDGTSVGLGITSIGTVRRNANISLNNYTWTISGDPHRQSQEMMKDFLDGVNNNRLPFGSATPCSVFYPQDK